MNGIGAKENFAAALKLCLYNSFSFFYFRHRKLQNNVGDQQHKSHLHFLLLNMFKKAQWKDHLQQL